MSGLPLRRYQNKAAAVMNILRHLALAGALGLAACGGATAEPPLAGAKIGGPIRLTDGNGQPFTERNLAGKWRVMYFGYTFCPDVCPTDVAAIGAGLKKVEAADPATGAKVVPVFVTVDPERDTPAVVRQFVAAFHPRMVGLTGTPQQVAAAAKAYAVWYQRGETSPGGGYLMDHGRQAYLMDPDGKPVALVPADKGADAVAETLEQWVR
jgi:protein SCO1